MHFGLIFKLPLFFTCSLVSSGCFYPVYFFVISHFIHYVVLLDATLYY